MCDTYLTVVQWILPPVETGGPTCGTLLPVGTGGPTCGTSPPVETAVLLFPRQLKSLGVHIFLLVINQSKVRSICFI
jgi:hypothetical protein